jgi:hypothetical protein
MKTKNVLTFRLCLFCSPHSNDKVIQTAHEAGHNVCDFKKACGSGVVRLQPSNVGTLILIDQFGRENFERGEIVSPAGCIASKVGKPNLVTPDARHRRPLKSFGSFQV